MSNEMDIKLLFRSIRERVDVDVHLNFLDRPREKWAGQYHIEGKYISLNRSQVAKMTILGVREVLLHEFAHAISVQRFGNCSHDKHFASEVRKLGGCFTGENVPGSPLYLLSVN